MLLVSVLPAQVPEPALIPCAEEIEFLANLLAVDREFTRLVMPESELPDEDLEQYLDDGPDTGENLAEDESSDSAMFRVGFVAGRKMSLCFEEHYPEGIEDQ